MRWTKERTGVWGGGMGGGSSLGGASFFFFFFFFFFFLVDWVCHFMTLLVMNLAAKSGKSGWLDGGGSEGKTENQNQ